MLDKNEAPPGFEAVEGDACNGCVFEHCAEAVCDALCEAHDVDCHPDWRPDRTSAIFIVRSSSAPATANFPCDDMGAPA